MSRVLVTGASGCVGRAVTSALRRGGHSVITAQRHGGDRPLDLNRPASVADVAAGVDVIVHLAARAHVVPRTDAEREEMRRVNAEGTAALVKAARVGADRPKIIYASTVAVYGPEQREEDSTALTPETVYGASKLAGEVSVREAGGVALRLALVYGAGDAGNVAVLARQVRRWGGAVLGDGSNRKSMVYAKHAADRIVRLVEREDWRAISAHSFNVSDEAPTQRALLGALAQAVGRKRTPPSLPMLPFRLAGEALDLLQRARGQSPRWRRGVDKLVEDTVFDGSRLDRLLDYTPPRTLEQAMRETFGGA